MSRIHTFAVTADKLVEINYELKPELPYPKDIHYQTWKIYSQKFDLHFKRVKNLERRSTEVYLETLQKT